MDGVVGQRYGLSPEKDPEARSTAEEKVPVPQMAQEMGVPPPAWNSHAMPSGAAAAFTSSLSALQLGPLSLTFSLTPGAKRNQFVQRIGIKAISIDLSMGF